MKARLYRFSPKLLMILSALLLIFSLLFLWSSTHFAMPTPLLAIKKAAAEQGLASGTWALYRPSIKSNSNTGGWYFSRRGDTFYIAQPWRDNGPLWSDALGPYPISPLSPRYLDFNPILDALQENFGFVGNDDVILVTTPDPAVARVQLVQGDRVADCTESAPGSGFWVGTLRTMDTDEDKDFPILAYAYAADGTLLHSTPSA